MNQDDVFTSFLMLELADGFKERLTFDVTNGSADFDNGNFRIFSGRVTVETVLDLICDVRDYLYGPSAEISPAFLLKNRSVDFAGRNVRILPQTFINESFIVS